MLLIDTRYVENRLEQFKIDVEGFLQKENYKLYISTSKIHKDKYSCGPIASEITRILYFNHASIKTLLPKAKIQDGNINLSSFLPEREFQQLLVSCKKDGMVNYGAENETLYAADFRVAHFAIALTFGIDDIMSQFCNGLDSVNGHTREKFRNAKHIVEKIRSTFMYNPNRTAWFDEKNIKLFNKKIAELCQKETHVLVEEREEQLSADQEESGTSKPKKEVLFNDQANQVKNINSAREESIDHVKSKKTEEAIPKLLENVNGLQHKSMNKEIKLREEIKTKEIQNKPKNIQYNQSTICFITAVALSALIITAAFLTQTYVILSALTVPIVIGLYGWSLYNTEENIINPDSKLNEVQNKSLILDGINCGG